MRYAPSCLTCLYFFAPYAPSCLPALRALRGLLKHLIYAPCASFSSVLHALFVRLKIFLGWIFSSPETSHFSRITKGATNRAVFMWLKKQPWNFLSGKIFQPYLKREINLMFWCFSLHLFKHEIINCLVWNNKKCKLKKKKIIFNLWYHHNTLQKTYCFYYKAIIKVNGWM